MTTTPLPGSSARPVHVLLVEDDPDDVYLTRQALDRTKLRLDLQVASDGVEAMQILRDEAGRRSQPDLILLDLNLPRMDGREVLAEIKSDPRLVHIPTVVLTTSRAEEDIVRTYQLHANCYISKPVDLDSFREVVSAIESFWFTVVQLPPETAAGSGGPP
jgi:two-component system, chemotaxis family, response regulator Rcp1